MAYAIAFRNAEQAAQCSSELQSLLIDNQNELVSSVDTILAPDILEDLPGLMTASILPNVDEGRFELLVDAIANTTAVLIDDQFDPQRNALAAIVSSLQNSKILQDQHGIDLARAILKDPGFPLGLHAVADLASIPDQNTSALDTLLDGAAHILQTAPTPSLCQGLSDQDYVTGLLQTENFQNAIIPGTDAWVARVDEFGNPLVATNPTTNDLSPPFVDQDNNGLADTNSEGLPIDSQGSIITLAPFGFGASFDDAGRHIASNGAPLFIYYNAKQTALAQGMRIAGEALAKGLLPHAAAILDAAMGAQQPCQGQENCSQYTSIDNPIYALLFTLLEVAQYEKPIVFLETWSKLLQDNPRLVESILVSAGTMIEALGDSNLQGGDPKLYAVVEEFLPLLALTFRIQTRLGRPMPRLLMDLISDLGQDARDFPEELLVSIEHTSLIKDNECSSEAPDPASPTVDFSRPRFFVQNGSTTVDNRSTLEKSVALLLAADCGSVPFTGGKTVAHTIIDLMSRLTPDTVCDLIDNLLGLLGVTGSIGEAVVNSSLFVVGCNDPDDVRAPQLFELDDLAKSGALDFYLPIAKTFRQQGELAALVRMLAIAAIDLEKDEDQSANTQSALRPFLPILAEVLRSGAVDPFFDLNELLVTVPAIDGDGTLADVLIDSAARLLDDTTTINTATGPVQGESLAKQLIDALHVSVQRIEAAGKTESLAIVTNIATGYLTKTTTINGEKRLADVAFVPMLASGFDALVQAARLPSPQLQCYITEWQELSRSWIESPVVAGVMRTGVALENYPNTAQLNVFLSRLLDPTPSNSPANSPTQYSELLRITAELLQSPLAVEGTDSLLATIAEALSQQRNASQLIVNLDQILYSDTEQTMWRLLSNAAGDVNTPQDQAPLFALLNLATEYASLEEENTCQSLPAPPVDVPALEQRISDFISFLRDDSSILTQLIKILKQRSSQ